MTAKEDKIVVDKNKRAQLVSSIKTFFIENRDEEIGDLQAELLIEFFIEKIGSEIYNQALSDAQTWFKSRMADLEIDYYSLERRDKKRRAI